MVPSLRSSHACALTDVLSGRGHALIVADPHVLIELVMPRPEHQPMPTGRPARTIKINSCRHDAPLARTYPDMHCSRMAQYKLGSQLRIDETAKGGTDRVSWELLSAFCVLITNACSTEA